MWLIIVGAIVNLLIFFFEQWWQKNHPTQPGAVEKAAFLAEVSRFKYIWMGPRRTKYAAALFDKYAANYAAKPPILSPSGPPLTQSEARGFAGRYAKWLTLTPDEV